MPNKPRSIGQSASLICLRLNHWLLAAAILLMITSGATALASTNKPSPFYLGADISELSQLEQQGAVYMDGDKPADALAIFMKNGWTCLRLRIWVDPRDGVN